MLKHSRSVILKVAKWLAGTTLVLVCVLLLARNTIARWTAEKIGSYVLATPVVIGLIDIRWSAILIENVSVAEPAAPDQTQLSVDRVVLVPASWQAMRDGVWLQQVVVDRPVLELRFDEQGELLSVFPTGSGKPNETGNFVIPIEHLIVNGAGLIVSQIGRQDFRVAGVDVLASFSETIAARVHVPSLLAGKIEFQCQLDAKSLAGTSRLDIVGVELDTQQLAALPLAPPMIADEPASASLSMSFRGTHPAHDLDLRQHDFDCRIATRDIASERFGSFCKRFDASLTHSDGQLEFNALANPVDGDLRLEASADISQTDFAHPDIRAVVIGSLRDCQLNAICQHFPELSELFAVASSDVNADLRWHDGALAFTTNLDARLRDVALSSLDLPAVTGRVSSTGRLTPGADEPLRGALTASLEPIAVELSKLAKHFELPPVQGSLGANAQLTLPLHRLSDPASYIGSASLQTHGIAGLDMQVSDATVTASLSDGNATIETHDLTVNDQQGNRLAALTGNLTASLLEQGRLRALTTISFQPSPALIRELGLEIAQPQGRLQCIAEADCSMQSLTDVRAWTASANVISSDVSIAGERIEDVDLHASLSDAVLTASPLTLRWRENTCTFQTGGKIDEQISLHGKLDAPSLNLQDVSEMLSRFSATALPATGLANIHGEFEFQQSLTSGAHSILASGTATLEEATFARTRIGTAVLKWNADHNGLAVVTTSNDFFGGRFTATARMAELDWTRTQIQGDFSEIRVPRLIALTNQRLPSTGTLEGGFRVTSIASLPELSGAAWMRSRQMTLSRVPIELGRTHVSVTAGQVRLDGDGRIADGRFNTTATGSIAGLLEFSAQTPTRLAEVPVEAQLHLSGVPIAPLAMALKMPPELRSLGGTLSATLSREPAAWDGRHLATATASVDDLRWNHARLSDRIVANATLHPTQIELVNVQGRFADGDLSGNAVVQLENTPTGRFDFLANRVNLRRATAAFGFADVSGSGTARVRGRIGPVISGSLDVSAENAVAAGVAVRQTRLPMEWSFMPASKTLRWQCRAGAVAIGGGNVRIATEGSYANALSMTTTVRVERVDLAKLMQSGSVGSGIVDGEVILRAKQARSAKQFVGTYDFEMKNIQALEIPVLDQLPKLVSLSPQIPGRGQNGGTVYGRIGGGLVHVDEIALYQSNVQILVSGTATLQGRLDLDVIASTESTSPTDQLISMLDSPLMLAAPAPVALIAKANELLKDRTIRVHVGGTATSPTLRLQPGKQLSQDAVKFFLTNSIGSTATQLSRSQSRNTRR